MSELKKDAKVRITNIMGVTEETATEPNFRIIGAEGYVHEVVAGEGLFVKVPTHAVYSKGRGAWLMENEVELVS